MLPTSADIERAVLDASNSLIADFQSNPYAYLYESDLQATLFASLRRALPGRLPIARTRPGLPPYELSLVCSEYNGRIDIACLDPEPDRPESRGQHKGDDTYIYNLPVVVGIELKCRKMGDRQLNFNACRIDMKKLKELSNHGLPYVRNRLVLAFVQDSEDFEAFLHPVLPEQRIPVPQVSKLNAIYVATTNRLMSIDEDFEL